VATAGRPALRPGSLLNTSNGFVVFAPQSVDDGSSLTARWRPPAVCRRARAHHWTHGLPKLAVYTIVAGRRCGRGHRPRHPPLHVRLPSLQVLLAHRRLALGRHRPAPAGSLFELNFLPILSSCSSLFYEKIEFPSMNCVMPPPTADRRRRACGLRDTPMLDSQAGSRLEKHSQPRDRDADTEIE